MPVDPQFGIDSYNRAKVLTESQTIINNIITLLFGKPGFYPSIPKLGMNIQQYFYSFEDDFDVNFLKAQLASQCKDFIDIIENGTFDIVKSTYNNQPLLVFSIPLTITKTETNLLLGVTLTNTGEFRFNFTFDNVQYI